MLVYIKVFLDDLEAMEALSDAERGRLLTALLKYAKTGEEQQLSGNERILFPMIRARIDRDMADLDSLREKKREAGRTGGLAKASRTKQMLADASSAKQNLANLAKTIDKDNRQETIDKDIFADYASGDVELLTALRDFETMRKKIKSPMTDRAKQLLCSKLDKSCSSSQEKIALLERSIVNNWKDVYPEPRQQSAKAPLVTSTPGDLELRMLRRLG